MCFFVIKFYAVLQARYHSSPEYWVNSAKVGSRASVTDTYRIVITEDFWDTESERAFNVSTITKEALTADDYETVANAFRIYLPVE